jgi:hypothetical protein
MTIEGNVSRDSSVIPYVTAYFATFPDGGRMRAVYDEIDGPFRIDEDIALFGTIAGPATLCEDTRFVLNGTIMGDLIVERGARAVIHETIAGRVYNDGGHALNSSARLKPSSNACPRP